MNPEKEFSKLHPMGEPNPKIRDLLLASLKARNLGAFQSFLYRAFKKKSSREILNFIYPPPEEKTLLEIACSLGFSEFVSLLLEYLEDREDVNKINESYQRAPIHFAVENGYLEVLRILLQDPFINPNLEAGTQTALHMAVKNRDFRSVQLLLKSGARPDIPNSKGVTALHGAALSKQKRIVEHILKISEHYEIPLDIDTFMDFRKQTARNVLEKNFPELQENFPKFQIRQVDDKLLQYFLNANDEGNFLKKFQEVTPDTEIDVATLIKMAARNNLTRVFVELINKFQDLDLTKAAEIAIERANFPVFEEILKYDPELGQKFIILTCRELMTPCSWSKDHQSIRMQFVKLILKQRNIDVRVKDEESVFKVKTWRIFKFHRMQYMVQTERNRTLMTVLKSDGKICSSENGNTPLHYAARAENNEALETLLRAGSFIGQRNRFGIPPLAYIRPVILEKYFDECISSGKEHTEDFEIHFDYNCFKPILSDGKSQKMEKNSSEIQTFIFISKRKNLKHLLKHPLLSSFLYLKWSRIRPILYANSILYSVFFIMLFAYTIISNLEGEGGKSEGHLTVEDILKMVTWVLLGIVAMRELLQLLCFLVRYITNSNNWITVISLTMLGFFLSENDVQLGAIGLLLSAWELVLIIGQHPKMAIDIYIFKTALKSFTLFLLLYGFLIFSFALAFFLTFKGDEKFPNAIISIFKTIVMLQGEFDASDMPFGMNPVFGRILFLLFTFFIAIVLFNLLVGIAVSNTQEIRANAELVTLIARAEMIAYAEGIASSLNFSKSKCCTCLKISENLNLNPFASCAKRISIFPNFLPGGKLFEKPFKNHQIQIPDNPLKLFNLKMDSSISDNAREILQRKNNTYQEKNQHETESEYLLEIKAVNQRLDKFESILMNLSELNTRNGN